MLSNSFHNATPRVAILDRLAQLRANGQNSAGLLVIGTFPLGIGDTWGSDDIRSSTEVCASLATMS